MARIILIELLLFLTPFLVYYLLVVRAKRGERVSWPWVYLSLAGLTLAICAMLLLAFLDGEDPDLTYQPPSETPRVIDPNKPAYRQ